MNARLVGIGRNRAELDVVFDSARAVPQQAAGSVY
jgi:hypothetical protein